MQDVREEYLEYSEDVLEPIMGFEEQLKTVRSVLMINEVKSPIGILLKHHRHIYFRPKSVTIPLGIQFYYV